MEILIRAIQAAITLYMLLILLRWLAPWIHLEIHARRWRWIPALTDPFLNQLRRILPPLGPFDFAPLIAVLLLWLARTVLVQALTQAGHPQ